ncbi:MAG: hypothetical protein V4702_05395 [Patescibacteria group bacterium]
MNPESDIQPIVDPIVEKPKIKLFSRRDFIVGGIVGGPLALTYFFYKNFKNQGNQRAAKLSLIVGPATFIGLIILTVVLEEVILHRTIPRFVFPAIIVGVTTGLYAKFQEIKVNQHIASGGELYKSRGAGVVLISIIVTILLFLGFLKAVIVTTGSDISVWDAIGLAQDYDQKAYEQKMNEITQNDQQAIKVFSLLNPSPLLNTAPTKADIIKDLDDGIARYKRNAILINEIDGIEKLPSVLKEDNARLRKYTELRVQMFELLKKAISEETKAYDTQIENIGKELEPLLQKPDNTLDD